MANKRGDPKIPTLLKVLVPDPDAAMFSYEELTPSL